MLMFSPERWEHLNLNLLIKIQIVFSKYIFSQILKGQSRKESVLMYQFAHLAEQIHDFINFFIIFFPSGVLIEASSPQEADKWHKSVVTLQYKLVLHNKSKYYQIQYFNSRSCIFFDKGKLCHNIALQMKHCDYKEVPRTTNHFL